MGDYMSLRTSDLLVMPPTRRWQRESELSRDRWVVTMLAVEALACGHARPSGRWKLCAHLLAVVPSGGSVSWVRLLPEYGLEGDLACRRCASLAAERRELLACCEDCVAVIERDVSYFDGFQGTPGIRERTQPLASTAEAVPLPAGLQDPLDLQPLESASGSVWVVLTAAGDLVRFDLDDRAATLLASAPIALAREPIPEPPPELTDHGEWRERQAATRAPRALHLSRDGRFAAIVAVHGSLGEVIDLRRGVATMRLDRGDSHVWACRFSCAFLERDGRTLLVHPTAWNRLDVSDPATGELLTPRGGTSYRRGEGYPPHYLDYFHGALAVSPSGAWIADDGWVWHPTGILRSWSVEAWLNGNVWESEDGPSVRALCARDYYWDKPICWVGETALAVSGIGSDDDHIIPGTRVFDVKSGAEQLAFAGPDGELFYDERLFSSNPDGLQVWDPSTGERLARLEGFRPTRHHPSARELIELRGDHLLRWRTPE